MPTPPTARNALDKYGLDAICADITAGSTLTGISKVLKVDISSLIAWVELEPQRSARVRNARISSAKMWDEKAETLLAGAKTDFKLAQAKELAHHYRWRASKTAPKEYGDKTAVEHSGSVTLQQLVEASMTPDKPQE